MSGDENVTERYERFQRFDVPAIPQTQSLLDSLLASLSDEDLERFRRDALRAVVAAENERYRRIDA